MRDEKFFLYPTHEWQRRYEALRASFVDRLPARVVSERFGYTPTYVNLLRHQFAHGKIDFSEPVPEGKIKRRKVDTVTRNKICSWREHRLSAGEIAQLLSEDGIEISIRTVERILAEEGYPKLPRRTRLKIGLTVQGAKVPETSQAIRMIEWDNRKHECQDAGIFIFAPFIQKLDIPQVVQQAGLPGSKMIPAINYFLSFLAVKLVGTQRYAHMGDHAFDSGIGLFAGLNVLPKTTAMSTYSYSLNSSELLRLQHTFVKQVNKLGFIDKNVINLDFHTVPHFGEESVLQKHWAGARNKRMKGALTLFAQDASSKLILYTAADIQKDEADDQVLSFLSFWQGIQRRIQSTFVFDSRFTTYANLSALNQKGVKFITLRRRGKNLIQNVSKLQPWNRIHIPHAKRKFPNPLVHESIIEIKDYEGFLRQVIIRGNGHEKPVFLISNDFDSPVELVVGNYSRRWRVENAISEAVKFFNLNALSSPILVKVHFDVIMTMIADTLYSMLAKNLRGFEDCDAPKIYRHFVKGKGKLVTKNGKLSVIYPKRAHNPILRAVPWHRMPHVLNWLEDATLQLIFS
jgi:transposase